MPVVHRDHFGGGAAGMKVLESAPAPVPVNAGTVTRLVPVGKPELPGLAAARRAGPRGGVTEDLFGRVTRLAAMVLGVPWASVAIAGERPPWWDRLGAQDRTYQYSPAERSWCRQVIGSGDKLIIEARPGGSSGRPCGRTASMRPRRCSRR